MKAKIINQSCWVLDKVQIEKDFLEELLISVGFNVLKSVEYDYKPCGYTKVWLLGESHFAIHTFPEESVIYLELSSCIESKAKLFWTQLFKRAKIPKTDFCLKKKNINTPSFK